MHPKQHTEVNKTRNDQLQAILFAAGMAVVIACLERAVVVSIFKHLHMWVFLALNLLLIAILFTSTKSPSKSQETEGTTKTESPAPVPDNHREHVINECEDELKLGKEEKEESDFEDKVEEQEEEEEEEEEEKLSNEELNERVEAFISRFRQEYLVSEVKISRSRSENVCGNGVFSKTITV